MTAATNKTQYRLDIRGKDGKVDRVKILEREVRGKFRPCDGDFTEEHVVHLRLFAKVVSAVAKGIAPPFDLDAIIQKANPRRKKRHVPKPSASAPSNDADFGWE
jgi:hypothetical protein